MIRISIRPYNIGIKSYYNKNYRSFWAPSSQPVKWCINSVLKDLASVPSLVFHTPTRSSFFFSPRVVWMVAEAAKKPESAGENPMLLTQCNRIVVFLRNVFLTSFVKYYCFFKSALKHVWLHQYKVISADDTRKKTDCSTVCTCFLEQNFTRNYFLELRRNLS